MITTLFTRIVSRGWYYVRCCLWLGFTIPILLALAIYQFFADREAFKRGDIL